MKFKLHTYFFSLLLSLMLFACSATKYLQENQTHLEAQIIKGNEIISEDALIPYFRQKPNRKIPLLGEPYLVAYYKGKKKYDKNIDTWRKELDSLEKEYLKFNVVDSTDSDVAVDKPKNKNSEKERIDLEEKINTYKQRIEKSNWLMSSVGDVPVVFDTSLMLKTATQMQLFLRQKGFFKAKVTPSFTVKNRRTTVTYTIQENQARLINRYVIACSDSSILKILNQDSTHSTIKQGIRFDEEALSSERDRVSKLMQNSGYMNFGKQFIYFDVDTVNVDKDSLDVRMTILNGESDKKHQSFTVGDVNIITDVGVESELTERNKDVYKGINYLAFKHKYSKKLLNSRIRIRPNDVYNRSQIEDTQRALAALDVFKFVNVKPDTSKGKVQTTIFASPAPINDISIEGGFNMVQAFPGPFLGISLKNRNTFNGCETLELRGRYSLEAQAGVIGTGRGYVGQEIGVNATLNFPKLLLFGEKFNNRVGAYLPRTRLTLGYIDVTRPEYSRTNIRAALTYDWTNKKNSTYSLNLFDVTVVNTTKVTDTFVKYLLNIASGGNTLLRSFDRLFISSVSFNYTYFNNTNFYLRGLVEVGGTTLNLLNNSIFKDGTILGLTAFRYVKLNLEARRYFQLGIEKDNMIALRGNIGVITPYGTIGGNPNTVLPYEKYFFTGGTNSIRAWRPRRLGPGSFAQIDPEKGQLYDAVEQPGEFLIEMNMEWRKKLFGFVHGALFVDAGNTWMLTRDSRPGSQFLLQNFWKEIAVGTGVGLRFDFSLVIMRFDLGIKVWNPALPLSQRFVLPQWNLKETTFNIGIGYPF